MSRRHGDESAWDSAHRYLDIPYARGLTGHATVPAALAERAWQMPDGAYLTTVAPDGTRTTVTFAEAHELSGRVAGWLRREFALKPGDVVALQPANDLAAVMTILAVLRSGAVCLLLSPNDPAARVRAQVQSQNAGPVLRSAGVPAGDGLESVELPDVTRLPPADFRDAALDATADALMFSTSGSTATAKMVAQSHRNAATNAEAFRRHHRLRPGDRILGFLPIYHVNGVHSTLMAPIVAGVHVTLAHAFNAFDYPDLLRTVRPRIASLVPSALEALLVTWRDGELPEGFEYFLSAAAPLAAETARNVFDRLGARIVQGYGLTETTNFSTTMPPDLDEDAYRRLMLDAEIPPIGAALFGNEVTIRTTAGAPVDSGETGEILVRGHNVMSRYAGNREATAEALAGGWFHTGDLGRFQHDPGTGGVYVVISGRIKNMAKVRGETVSLEEMERALRSHPQILDAACVATPHRLTGEQITAAVVAPAGVPDDLSAHLRTLFAEAALPSRILLVDAVPRTPTGKIRRPDLAALLNG